MYYLLATVFHGRKKTQGAHQMKSQCIAITVLAIASVTLGMSTAYADKMKCKSHGDFVRCALPNANHRHVSLHEETSHNKCEKGYSWGADSDGIWVDNKCKGVFHYRSDKGYHEDYQERHSRHAGRSGDCPSDIRGNECAYYRDGYKAGKDDGRASMSRAYERYSDDYDSRFEKYFARGYKAGWNDYR
jgi:hypothetical protein